MSPFSAVHDAQRFAWLVTQRTRGARRRGRSAREVHGPVEKGPVRAAARGRCDNTLATSQSTILLALGLPQVTRQQHHDAAVAPIRGRALATALGRADLDVGRPGRALSDLTGALRAPPETAVLWSSIGASTTSSKKALLVRRSTRSNLCHDV